MDKYANLKQTKHKYCVGKYLLWQLFISYVCGQIFISNITTQGHQTFNIQMRSKSSLNLKIGLSVDRSQREDIEKSSLRST